MLGAALALTLGRIANACSLAGFLSRFLIMRTWFFRVWLVIALPAWGAEMTFKFDETPVNETPAGFRSALYGKGGPGEWKVVLDDVPPLIEPATTRAPVVTRRPVLAQVSHDPADEHFPLLIYDKETFGDFTLTTRFKIVDGVAEQMAGIVFRFQNETNFYVIRASSMDNTLKFYKVVNGIRAPMLGPKLEIPRNVWHELKVDCKGNQIRAWFDDKEAIQQISDSTFMSGKVGFWTKSDAVSYFGDTRISYTPRESLAQVLVRDAMQKYSRLRGLKIYTLDENKEPRVAASKDPADVGAPGDKNEKDTIARGTIFFGRDKKNVNVLMPLRDRNGEPMAAVSLTMESFTGQTEQNAIVRAMPIVKAMQVRAQSLKELTQ